MLQASKETQHILKIAAFFETLPSDRYRQQTFLSTQGERCICGWTNWLNCKMPDDVQSAREYLGLSRQQAQDLFNGYPVDMGLERPDSEDASRVLRHLAVTGEVDWSCGPA